MPTVVSVPGGAVDVASGSSHSCAVSTLGVVFCWGSNAVGECGTAANGSRPARIVGLPGDAVQVAAGFAFTCARLAGGEVYCWGLNTSGELGDGSEVESRAEPGRVPGLLASRVELGWGGACAVVAADGTVVCWGGNHAGQAGGGPDEIQRVPQAVWTPPGVIDLAVSGNHACALEGAAGTVWCWGQNNWGQLGNPAGGGPDALDVALPEAAVALDGGAFNTCAVGESGQVYCWGMNTFGTVGNDVPGAYGQPVPVAGLDDGVRVAVGLYSQACAVRATGEVWCWGRNDFGQAGGAAPRAVPHPVQVAGLEDVAAVAANGGTTCALDDSGEVWCWGDGGSGQGGAGYDQDRAVPTLVEGIGGARAVAPGTLSSCAVTLVGTVACWGSNMCGGLGDGSPASPWAREAAGPLVRFAGADGEEDLAGVVEMGVGDGHACARRGDGTVACWGCNQLGQVGDGSNEDRLVAVPVEGLDDAAVLAVGRHRSCAIRAGGEVACWGEGWLGNGEQGPANSPTPVLGLEDATQVAVNVHTCAVLAGGTVECWGAPQAGGTLGHEEGGASLTPVPVFGLADVTARQVEVGIYLSCTLADGDGAPGQVFCWSGNFAGQLGDGTFEFRLHPVRVLGLERPAVAVATGDVHACALLDSGRVWCWGSNDQGALGDGSVVPIRTSPARVPGFP